MVIGVLALWIVLYCYANPSTHLGAFYGNAIADWSGSVAVVVLTKFLYERGSAESKRTTGRSTTLWKFAYAHSLSIVLLVTGIGWAILYSHQDPTSKWGQVTGNIASEWLQMLGLVLLTKRFIEIGSKESR